MNSTENQEENYPILQIVHVTDLHVKSISSNPELIKGNFIQRVALEVIKGRNIGDWKGGTEGHLPKAPDSFRNFLRRFREKDPDWAHVQTWLVDTGDRTAYGDNSSLELGNRLLAYWAKELGNHKIFSIYGNHDAWPGTLPLVQGNLIQEQRSAVHKTPGWNPLSWINSPLEINIPDSNSKIQLFGLDTVNWSLFLNTLALGSVDSSSYATLQKRIAEDVLTGQKNYRILATHHPFAFPWKSHEILNFGVIPSMRILRSNHWIHKLNAFADGPLAHLLLAGHTHLAHPGLKLPDCVTKVEQGYLSPYQLQLVGGALMLNTSSVRNGITPPNEIEHSIRSASNFNPPTVLSYSCQAQILRFSYYPRSPQKLSLIRMPVISHCGEKYFVGPPTDTTVYISDLDVSSAS